MADIALAASAREWPDRLHRFVLDHGGGRIVDRIMSPDSVSETQFDVLVIDDICSFLTPRLIETVKAGGREVLGVYAPEDGSSAKRRLLECGISDVIETEATPEEFVAKIGAAVAHRPNPGPAVTRARPPLSVGVTGPCAGVGATEVSIALSVALAQTRGCVLVDLDPVWPSVAQRLDLPIHPNVRTALDHAFHRPKKLDDSLIETGIGPRLIGGRADGGRAEPVSRHEVVSLFAALTGLCEVVVADLGSEPDCDPALFREFDTVLLVSTADPVGASRLIKSADRLLSRNPGMSVLAIANQARRDGYHKAEVSGEISRALSDVPAISLPRDRRLDEAAWNGRVNYGKRFRKQIDAVASLVSEATRSADDG